MNSQMYIRTIGELGPSMILAPERYRAQQMSRRANGITLGSLVEERGAVVDPSMLTQLSPAPLILDTTHVKDGRVDLAAAMRATPSAGSAKRRVYPGDLLVSRLRPYLRQIGYAHPALFEALGARLLLASSEFAVLAPTSAASLAFLLPALLGSEMQAVLAAGQEGGHHPRVPRATLLALELPQTWVAKRGATSRQVDARLAAFYEASFALDRALAPA